VRVGLIAFAGDPEIAAPPTRDRELVRISVDELGLFAGYGGTAIGDALQAAVDLGTRSQSDLAAAQTKKRKDLVSILFLSDGHQTRGALQPLDGAQLAKEAGIRVYTVALGTPNGVLRRPAGGFGGGFGGFGGPRVIPVPPDPATLSAIARTTGGRFFNARSADAAESAYKTLGSQLGRVPARTEITYVFLAAAVALLVAAGVLSALWSPRLP
jgi:Ca-activated chloride channel family protein